MQRISLVILISIVFLSALVRLYHFNSPMVDLHSWRQADTAAVARNLVYSGFDILHPRILSAVSIDGMGRDNTERYHFAEFPLYQIVVAGVSLIFGDVVIAGRIVSIVSGLLTVIVVYMLAKRYYSESVSLLASGIYGLLPYAFFWSRTVLPDGMMLLFSLLALYYFDVWIRGPQGRILSLFAYKVPYAALVSCLFFSLALLLKIFPLFLLIPMLYMYLKREKMPFVPSVILAVVPVIAWNVYLEIIHVRPMRIWLLPIVGFLAFVQLYYAYTHRRYIFRLKPIMIYLAFAIIPFLLWRLWIQQWPMSIPASDWLFDGKNLRFRPAWWHWIFQERLDRLMFNFSGLLLIGFGLYFHKKMFLPLTVGVTRVRSLFETVRTILLSLIPFKSPSPQDKEENKVDVDWSIPVAFATCLLYFVVLATGNVTHEYYQIIIIPFGSILMASGFMYLWNSVRTLGEAIITRAVLIVLLGLTFLLGWYSVRDWYIIANPMIPVVGRRADLLLPPDALVIAPYGGDTTFLYYINRPGWSVIDKKLQEMIDRGATHYVSNYRDESTNRLARLYTVVEDTPEYVILDLRTKSNDPEWESIPSYGL